MDTNTHECEAAADASDLDGIVHAVVAAAHEVSNVLGAGFLEKVYERALIRELAPRGLNAKSQVSFPVTYKGHLCECVADLARISHSVVD